METSFKLIAIAACILYIVAVSYLYISINDKDDMEIIWNDDDESIPAEGKEIIIEEIDSINNKVYIGPKQ